MATTPPGSRVCSSSSPSPSRGPKRTARQKAAHRNNASVSVATDKALVELLNSPQGKLPFHVACESREDLFGGWRTKKRKSVYNRRAQLLKLQRENQDEFDVLVELYKNISIDDNGTPQTTPDKSAASPPPTPDDEPPPTPDDEPTIASSTTPRTTPTPLSPTFSIKKEAMEEESKFRLLSFVLFWTLVRSKTVSSVSSLLLLLVSLLDGERIQLNFEHPELNKGVRVDFSPQVAISNERIADVAAFAKPLAVEDYGVHDWGDVSLIHPTIIKCQWPRMDRVLRKPNLWENMRLPESVIESATPRQEAFATESFENAEYGTVTTYYVAPEGLEFSTRYLNDDDDDTEDEGEKEIETSLEYIGDVNSSNTVVSWRLVVVGRGSTKRRTAKAPKKTKAQKAAEGRARATAGLF